MKNTPAQASWNFANEQSAILNLAGVGAILGVSAATVRNWVKSGQLKTKARNGRLAFDATHIQEVKERLLSGELSRLGKRANKRQSRETFVPEEYSGGKEVTQAVVTLVKQFNGGHFGLRPFLLSAILRLLNGRRNAAILKELEWWGCESGGEHPALSIELSHEGNDFLGLLYQSLFAKGRKAETGSYYTPPEVARSMVKENVKAESDFLDPCCGAGLFLLEAADLITNPRHIWGYDIDEYAVRIARINLILRFPEVDFTPNVYCRDGLLHPEPSFDIVATNPPWGVHFSNEQLTELRALYGTDSNESFAFFIYAGLRHLREGGVLSVLLPEAFLNIRTHQEIRRRLLHDTSILKTVSLGRIFKNVFTPVVRLDTRKKTPGKEDSFVALSRDGSRTVSQQRLRGNASGVFDILSNGDDHDLLDLLYSRAHLTLVGQAEWALGIVTGNNSHFLSAVQANGTEPILLGKNLRRFVWEKPTRYIRFQPETFQQVAPESKYRAPEKLVYRFISNELIFAYDNRQTLALNSANVLIPHLDGYSIKTCLAFLNSKVFQYIFQKNFKALKVLRGDLEKLPFPVISAAIDTALSGCVDLILNIAAGDGLRTNAYRDLNEITMDVFGLSNSQRLHIERAIILSPRYLPFRVGCGVAGRN